MMAQSTLATGGFDIHSKVIRKAVFLGSIGACFRSVFAT